MGAEFIAAMSDGGSGYYIFEHDVTRHVPGDVETVRTRLADALEQMGYRVLNDNPIQARRSARGGAGSQCSFDILEYQTTLNIGVKSAGANSTRVTFDYAIKGAYGGWLSKGDRNTITREAEAIIATALARSVAVNCTACGADTSGVSRFCRQCGSPLGAATPAEVEVLRLTSNANTSHKNITGGIVFLLLAVAILPVLFFGSDDPLKFAKLLKVIVTISSALGACGLLMLLFAARRLSDMLKQPIEQDSLPRLPRRNVVAGVNIPDTNELPPASIQHPVTEATTDLLHHEINRAS